MRKLLLFITLSNIGLAQAPTTSGGGGGVAASVNWSSNTSPSGNLALTMASHTSVFTSNAATGASDLWKWTDTASNTGTGILMRTSTASGSTVYPWQADANGVGWQVDPNGKLQSIGSSASGIIDLSGSSSGTVRQTVAAAAGTWTFTWPTTAGSSGNGLSTDGSGVASWVSFALQRQTNHDAWCNGTVGTGNATTYYLVPGALTSTACTNSTAVGTPMSAGCVAGNLRAVASAAGGAAGSGVVSVYLGGVVTTLTCTLGTGTTCSDVTHFPAFGSGNAWTIGVTTGQGTDTTANIRASFQCI